MSVSNRVKSNIEAAKLDLEATIEMKLDGIKSEHVKTIDSHNIKYQVLHQTKFLHHTNNQIIILPIGHSYNHPTSIHMHHNSPNCFSSNNPEGNTLLQLQKWRYVICSAFCQPGSTNKSFLVYKYLK